MLLAHTIVLLIDVQVAVTGVIIPHMKTIKGNLRSGRDVVVVIVLLGCAEPPILQCLLKVYECNGMNINIFGNIAYSRKLNLGQIILLKVCIS